MCVVRSPKLARPTGTTDALRWPEGERKRTRAHSNASELRFAGCQSMRGSSASSSARRATGPESPSRKLSAFAVAVGVTPRLASRATWVADKL